MIMIFFVCLSKVAPEGLQLVIAIEYEFEYEYGITTSGKLYE